MIKFRVIRYFFLLGLWCGTLHAQNLENVGPLFTCESISQLTQTFEHSGTKSNSLQSMMRSIQRESLSSGFDAQIISELGKRPWRQNTVKELEAEFQIIKGQFNAGIILEDEARRRLACELAKYLHRDYLLNFDQQSLFSVNSNPFKFYTYVRENRLWSNLLVENQEEDIAANPGFQDTETIPQDDTQIIQPKNDNSLNALTILYYVFLLACCWLLLSLFLGIVFKKQRFTNPSTQKIFEFLLLPFQLIKPMITADPLREQLIKAQNLNASKQASISEERIQSMIDNRLAAAQTIPIQAKEEVSDKEDRIQRMEQELAELRKNQQLPLFQPQEEAPNPDPVKEELLSTIDDLQYKIDMLERKVDLLNSHLEKQQESLEQQELSSQKDGINQNKVLELINQELADYDLELDKRIKILEAKNAHAPTTQLESTPQEDQFSPGLSIAPKETVAPSEKVVEDYLPQEQEKEEELPLGEQLELSPLPSNRPQLIWYASSPQRGLFYGRRLAEGFQAKETVYKILVDRNDPNKASFTLVDDEPTIRLAMNMPDSYFTPAMELHGPGKISEAQHIGPIEAGSLIKEGDNWRIVKKGVLHYS